MTPHVEPQNLGSRSKIQLCGEGSHFVCWSLGELAMSLKDVTSINDYGSENTMASMLPCHTCMLVSIAQCRHGKGILITQMTARSSYLRHG